MGMSLPGDLEIDCSSTFCMQPSSHLPKDGIIGRKETIVLMGKNELDVVGPFFFSAPAILEEENSQLRSRVTRFTHSLVHSFIQHSPGLLCNVPCLSPWKYELNVA